MDKYEKLGLEQIIEILQADYDAISEGKFSIEEFFTVVPYAIENLQELKEGEYKLGPNYE